MGRVPKVRSYRKERPRLGVLLVLWSSKELGPRPEFRMFSSLVSLREVIWTGNNRG